MPRVGDAPEGRFRGRLAIALCNLRINGFQSSVVCLLVVSVYPYDW